MHGGAVTNQTRPGTTPGDPVAGTPAASRKPIRVLSPLVASQIAAGEVVERPASVVKELIENALDAHGTRVVVELEQGGIELIRVTDDGQGIAEGELRLALTPHATSKVASADELEHIGTMGFRGEALASIASVSRASIRSRTPQAQGASIIEAEGDVIVAVRPASGPIGTSVTVRNIFFNTPARRKFLRTPATEQGRCAEVVREIAIAHPGIGFALIVDGRTLLDLPAGQTPRQRVLDVLGKELAPQLLEVQADSGARSQAHAGVLTLWGLIGMPSLARGTLSGQHVALNGRVIRDRTIQHAIKEAYRGLIEPGRHPTAVLLLEMDPRGVDVNVHPAKTEVRFRDSSLVHGTVLSALRQALQGADLTASWQAESRGHAFAQGLLGPGVAGVPSGAPLPRPVVTPAMRAEEARRFVEGFKARYQSPGRSLGGCPSEQATGATSARIDFAALQAAMAGATPATAPQAPELLSITPTTRPMQVHNSYLVTQDAQGMLIIDQHALHERVMFQKLLARVLGGASVPPADAPAGSAPVPQPLESQRLLTQVVVHTEPRAVEVVEHARPLLERLGIEARPLGPASVGVSSFPTFLFDRNVEVEPFVGDLLVKLAGDGWAEGSITDPAAIEGALAEVLDMMACKAAIKAGNQLSDMEVGELLATRESIERISACPHGRPTSVRLTMGDLEKLFHRG